MVDVKRVACPHLNERKSTLGLFDCALGIPTSGEDNNGLILASPPPPQPFAFSLLVVVTRTSHVEAASVAMV